jgi:hypothetical protein
MGELSALVKKAEGAEFMMGKNTTFDVPPPGVGFTTVTKAVLAVVISEARIEAVNCRLLMKLVVRALPFQFTVAPETNPVPSKKSVKIAPPGAVLVGTRG